MNNRVLTCEKISKSYRDHHEKIMVLDQIDLIVMRGECIAIMGQSGSGKSTLLHLLGGLDKPTSGRIFWGDSDIALGTEKEKCALRNRTIGFVYQFHHLLPEFTALENVCMPLLIRGEKPAHCERQARELLHQVGLEKRSHHKIGELSGGERQRVAIARALVTHPACILADEPTGNLDGRHAAHVFDLFLTLQKTFNTTVVMVTHDSTLARRADRALVLQDGHLNLL